MVLPDEIHFVESLATEKETYNWALIRSSFRLLVYKELHVNAIFNLKATDVWISHVKHISLKFIHTVQERTLPPAWLQLKRQGKAKSSSSITRD